MYPLTSICGVEYVVGSWMRLLFDIDRCTAVFCWGAGSLARYWSEQIQPQSTFETEGSVVSDTGNTSSSVVKSKKSVDIRGQAVPSESAPGSSKSKKNIVSADVAVVKESGGSGASKKPKKGKSKANEDPDVRHRLKKL